MATKTKGTKPATDLGYVVDGQTGELIPRKRTVPEGKRKPKPEPMPGQ